MSEQHPEGRPTRTTFSDDGYLAMARHVLGDKHSFIGLVDAMPRPHHSELDFDGTGDTFEDPEGTILGDARIVEAARVSIAGQGVRPTSDDRKLIRYLLKNRHTTPFEQVRFTFHVRLPIFVARQWIRHRTGSFNEESARYGQLRGDFYIPAQARLKKQAKKNKQGSGAQLVADPAKTQVRIADHSFASYRLYEELLGVDPNDPEAEHDGLARELARAVLPVNIYTQWFWTTDLHNLMHFLVLRLHDHAQWEARQYAEAIVPMAAAVAPYAMEAFRDFRCPEGAVPRIWPEHLRGKQ